MNLNDFIDGDSIDYANEILESNSIINVDLYDFKSIFEQTKKQVVINRFERLNFLDKDILLSKDLKEGIVFISAHEEPELREISLILDKIIKATNKDIQIIYGISTTKDTEYIYICI